MKLSRLLPVLMGGGAASVPFPVIADNNLLLISDIGVYQDSAMTIPAAADGDRVGGWVDQSGAGNNVVQATSGNRLFFHTNQLNGKPSIGVEAGPQNLRAAAAVNLSLSNTMTFVIVFSVTDYAFMFSIATKTMQVTVTSSNRLNVAVGDGTTSVGYVTALNQFYRDGTPYAFVITISATKINAYKNGANVSIDNIDLSTALTSASTQFYVESNSTPTSAAMKGYLFANYDRVLTGSELNQIGAYINARYGVAWTDFP